jgi:hypothetical protein
LPSRPSRASEVRGGAELVEVTAREERRAGPVQHDGLVALRDPQRVDERVPQLAAVGIAAFGPVQGDVQLAAGSRDEHRLRHGGRFRAWSASRQPALELVR